MLSQDRWVIKLPLNRTLEFKLPTSMKICLHINRLDSPSVSGLLLKQVNWVTTQPYWCNQLWVESSLFVHCQLIRKTIILLITYEHKQVNIFSIFMTNSLSVNLCYHFYCLVVKRLSWQLWPSKHKKKKWRVEIKAKVKN